MDELQWESETDPFVLLDFLYPVRGLDSTEQQTRSSRLYLLGCARQAWDRLPPVGRALVEFSERLVDRQQLDQELRRTAQAMAEELTHCRGEPAAIAEIERKMKSNGLMPSSPSVLVPPSDSETWSAVAHLVYFPFAGVTPHYRRVAPAFQSVELIREVFGPFRRIRFDPEWLDSNVVCLARGIAAERDFSPMPVLADALQDAGCENPYILEHCRGPHEHIRGCWVIEGILNRREKSS